MTKEDTQSVSKLKEFYFEHKRMPTYRELADLMHWKSKFSAQYWVKKWLAAGIVEKDSSGKLLPGSIFRPVKVLGTVQAGWPSPAEEEMVDTISLDEWLISNREATFMLKVTGDSMIDAGIRPGDTVLVHRGKQPRSGDVVVAEVDHEWTIKFFVQNGKSGKISLKPANKNYDSIVPQEELRIAGVVTSVIRKYY